MAKVLAKYRATTPPATKAETETTTTPVSEDAASADSEPVETETEDTMKKKKPPAADDDDTATPPTTDPKKDEEGATTTAETKAGAATFAELDAMVSEDVPDRSAFLVRCQKAGMTVAQANSGLQSHLLAALKGANERAASADKLKGQGGGSPAVPTKRALPKSLSGSDAEAPVSGEYASFESYTELVAHLRSPDGGNMTRAAASKKANELRPDLRQKFAQQATGAGEPE